MKFQIDSETFGSFWLHRQMLPKT